MIFGESYRFGIGLRGEDIMSQSMNASRTWLPAFEGAKSDEGVSHGAAQESNSTGLGDAVGDWRPVSVGAQRLELLAKMLGIRFKKAVRRSHMEADFAIFVVEGEALHGLVWSNSSENGV